MTDASLYQAERRGTKEVAQQILQDSASAIWACDQFEKDNPPDRFQKKLIDWSQWRREFVIFIAHTARVGETLWSFGEYHDEKYKSGWTEDRIKAEWENMKDDPRFEMDGEDIWILGRKMRFRESTKRIDNNYTEGSKAMKKVELSDANNLKEFKHTSVASHGDAFFKADAKRELDSPAWTAPTAGEDGGAAGRASLQEDEEDRARPSSAGAVLGDGCVSAEVEGADAVRD